MNFCEICNTSKPGYLHKTESDNGLKVDDIVFICYGCGTLMTNSADNLKYYTRLVEILEISDKDELKKAEILENHFNDTYSSAIIKKNVRKLMFKNGKWVTVTNPTRTELKKTSTVTETVEPKNINRFTFDSDSDSINSI